MNRQVRGAVAVALALVAAAFGALAVGLEAPALAGVSAVAAVLAAATFSFGLPARRTGNQPPRPGTEPREHAPGEEGPLGGEAQPAPPTLEAADWESARDAAADLVDPVTGLLDDRYFVVALERRVAGSRRKLAPFALVLLELQPEDPSRVRVSDQSMKVLAAVVRAVLRESDTGCRLDEHTLGILLEDTPEAGAVWATERVRAGFFATTFRGNVRLAAGIAAYPAHALEPDRLLGAAREAVQRSRRSGTESIEIARPDEPTEGAGGGGAEGSGGGEGDTG